MIETIFFGLLAIVVVAFVLLGPIVALSLTFVLRRRVRDLTRRVQYLEEQAAPQTPPAPALVTEPIATRPVVSASPGPFAAATPAPSVTAAPLDAEVIAADLAEEPAAPGLPASPIPESPSINWEELIGRKALGWVAAVLVIFGAAFFLQYAYKNQWIGHLGRVAIGLTAGLGLILGGWWQARRGWRVFSQMMSSAGIVVVFLSVYSSFAVYHLLPKQIAGVFLTVVIVESALLAVFYNAPALAWMSLIGGLLTPVLLSSEKDQYQSLFMYLTTLNLGVLLLVVWRKWRGLATLALLGSQALFWGWYGTRYHPEKLAWAIGFQGALFAVFVCHSLLAQASRSRRTSWEQLWLLVMNAFLWFGAAYLLLRDDHREWLGLFAIGMASVYTLLGHLVLKRRGEDNRLLLAALGVAVGFMTLAFPIQARAEWVALGWAAEAAALWWFGLRVRAEPLRIMAAFLMIGAVGRVVLVDTLLRDHAPAWPIFNDYAVPALGVTVCLLASVAISQRFRTRASRGEQILTGMAGVGGLLLLWLVLSVDIYSYVEDKSSLYVAESHWLSQMTLSALWAVYALVVLAVGFSRRIAAARWTALFIFGVTIVKVFLADMVGLQEFYRILAFFILAILLALAGWAYQRTQVDRRS